MNLYLRVSLIIGILLYFAFLFLLLKKNSLNLKYTLLWLLTGVIMLLVVLVPGVIAVPLKAIGVVEWTNGIFCVDLIIFDHYINNDHINCFKDE